MGKILLLVQITIKKDGHNQYHTRKVGLVMITSLSAIHSMLGLHKATSTETDCKKYYSLSVVTSIRDKSTFIMTHGNN